jgi:glycine cleavage system aminomethyltransferase T
VWLCLQGEARLSLVTLESGGILDDTVITNYGDHVCVRQSLHARARGAALWR